MDQLAINFSAPIRFNGADYQPERDNDRLHGQLLRIFDCMKSGAWRTPSRRKAEIIVKQTHGLVTFDGIYANNGTSNTAKEAA